MINRRSYRQYGEGRDRFGERQAEQFDHERHNRDRYWQMGDQGEYDAFSQMNTAYDDYGDRHGPRGYRADNYRRGDAADTDWRYSSAGNGAPYRGGPYGGGYGGSAHRDRGSPPYGDFTSNDIGGRDFSGARQDYGYGEGRAGGDNYGSAYGGQFGAAPAGAYSRQDERGFFDRAGDEIASWFGDEDAARRREMDHSGHGPTNYTRSDERILEDVCDQITRDRGVDGRSVQVTVQGGEVTLDGSVASRQQKRRAEDCADDVSGVKHVQNNLRVSQRGSSETA